MRFCDDATFDTWCRLRDGHIVVMRSPSITMTRCSGSLKRNTTRDGRSTASVPRATSGRSSSEDVVVSVKRAVSVLTPAAV